jgi:hypothetical protein
MTVPITDTISRTALIGVYEGDHRTVHDALAAHADTGIAIVADPSVCADVAGQAALCTAVATAVRAFGTVTVVTGVDTVLVAGPHQGRTLGEAITTEGAHLAANLRAIPAHRPVLLIGAPTPCATGEAPPAVLRTTWTGWTARVQPGTFLAAIAAGALAYTRRSVKYATGPAATPATGPRGATRAGT